MTFGGSPTGVRVPPTFEKMTIVINIGTGLRPITSHKRIVTGVISRMVVTLSKNADKIAVNKDRVVIKGHTLPLVIWREISVTTGTGMKVQKSLPCKRKQLNSRIHQFLTKLPPKPSCRTAAVKFQYQSNQ